MKVRQMKANKKIFLHLFLLTITTFTLDLTPGNERQLSVKEVVELYRTSLDQIKTIEADCVVSSPDEDVLDTLKSAGINLVQANPTTTWLSALQARDMKAIAVLYDGKISNGAESAQNLRDLADRMDAIGYKAVSARGDAAGFSR